MSNTFSITFKSLLFILVIHLLIKHFSSKYLNNCNNDMDLDFINSSDEEEDYEEIVPKKNKKKIKNKFLNQKQEEVPEYIYNYDQIKKNYKL